MPKSIGIQASWHLLTDSNQQHAPPIIEIKIGWSHMRIVCPACPVCHSPTSLHRLFRVHCGRTWVKRQENRCSKAHRLAAIVWSDVGALVVFDWRFESQRLPGSGDIVSAIMIQRLYLVSLILIATLHAAQDSHEIQGYSFGNRLRSMGWRLLAGTPDPDAAPVTRHPPLLFYKTLIL